MNIWVSSGNPENWQVAIKEGGVWGVKPTLKKLWDKLSEGDILAFYASTPISGVIGFGRIKSKSIENTLIWPDEKNSGKAIWTHRFRFEIIHFLKDENLWKTKKVPITDLRIPRAAGLNFIRERSAAIAMLQRADVDWGTNLTPLISPEAAKITEIKEISPHEDAKNKIFDIGVLQGWISKKEFPLDGDRLDTVWIRRGVEGANPAVVFEVHDKGDPDKALGKLKHARDKWNSKPAIVTTEECVPKINQLLGGRFHEIADEIKILTLEDIKKLYDAEKRLYEIKKEKALNDILTHA